MIYEIIQFDALNELDPQPFYREQAEIRRSLLKKHFPVYMHRNHEGVQLIFSAVSAPHPYSIDTCPISIECSDGKIKETHELTDPRNQTLMVHERAMISHFSNLSSGSTVCKVYANFAENRLELFESPPVLLSGDIGAGEEISYDLTAQFDAVACGNKVCIDPERRVSPDG